MFITASLLKIPKGECYYLWVQFCFWPKNQLNEDQVQNKRIRQVKDKSMTMNTAVIENISTI